MEIHYGDWTIVQKIGSGAFGTVYEIQRETLGFIQKAALKVISIPQSSSDVDAIRSAGMSEASIGEYYRDLAAQIMLELKTMDQLKGHTNIVSYEDHTVEQKESGFGWDIYIRMELLTPLSKYMLHHSMSRAEVIRLGIDLCSALERCEALNIIHRDIKPDNILLSAQGDGKLGDFGIARTVEKTMSGMSKKGTYNYMAPEVYMGYPYGKTVDIYSLGLVLYRLLNHNRGPFLPAYPKPIRFQDQEQALVRRIKGERIPAPVQADKGLAEVVLKACSADPAQRYSTAAEMRKALQELWRTSPEPASPFPGARTKNRHAAPAQRDRKVRGVPSEQAQQNQMEYPPNSNRAMGTGAGTAGSFDGRNQTPSGAEAERNDRATGYGQRVTENKTWSLFKDRKASKKGRIVKQSPENSDNRESNRRLNSAIPAPIQAEPENSSRDRQPTGRGMGASAGESAGKRKENIIDAGIRTTLGATVGAVLVMCIWYFVPLPFDELNLLVPILISFSALAGFRTMGKIGSWKDVLVTMVPALVVYTFILLYSFWSSSDPMDSAHITGFMKEYFFSLYMVVCGFVPDVLIFSKKMYGD